VLTKPEELAAILYTVGHDGASEGRMLLAPQPWQQRARTRRRVGLPAATSSCALPIYHVHGLFVAVHCAMLAGARMLWLAQFGPAQVRTLLPRATVMMGVPTFYTRLLADSEFGADDWRSMRLFVSDRRLCSRHVRSVPHAHRPCDPRRYGMSETGMNTIESAHGRGNRGHRGATVARCPCAWSVTTTRRSPPDRSAASK
jgi:malonyl-CoA/methylmalonyl-CoA synthetase